VAIDHQSATNRHLGSHYEDVILSQMEQRPERLEKVVIQLPRHARQVEHSEMAEFRKQLFGLIRREYAKVVSAWAEPQWAKPQRAEIRSLDLADFPLVDKYLSDGELLFHPLLKGQPQERWVVVAPIGGVPFSSGVPFKR
jgi:hypothetical protein